MKASDLFVRALENEGVEYIFTVPGEEILDLMESIRTSSIKLVVLRHEQVAGFMAASYGRLTGKPGVCLTTLGPGATNVMTAVAYAQLGGMPMIMITGQKAIKTHPQGRFQVVDVVDMMRPLTKKAQTVVHVKNIPAMVRESFHLAQEETLGVVHLELPEDVAQESCEEMQPFSITPFYPPYASQVVLEQAIQKMEAAKRPLLMIGAAANRMQVSKALTDFLFKVPLPFFSTQMGKGVVDESHPLYLGTAALSQGDFVHAAIEHADLIINVGHDIVEKPPFFMSDEGAEVIHINAHPAQIDDTYFPQLEVTGDIAYTIDTLRQKVTPPAHYDFAHYERIKQKAVLHIKDNVHKDTLPMTPPRIVAAVQKAMPRDGILALDNGMYKIWFARNYKAHQLNGILLDNALAAMGAGVSVGMAAKMIYPERKVVVICGDGGFLMNSNALASVVDLDLELVIVLLRDNGYGMIQWKQEEMHFTSFGLSFGNPDFVQHAESYGVFGKRILCGEELSTTIAECLQKKGSYLIEVPVDYSENAYMLGEQLAAYTSKL